MTPSLQALHDLRSRTNHLNVEEAVQAQGQARYLHGLAKYGQTMDRTDLSPLEWLQHIKEELMDGVRYIERMQRELERCTKWIDKPDAPGYWNIKNLVGVIGVIHVDANLGFSYADDYFSHDRLTGCKFKALFDASI